MEDVAGKTDLHQNENESFHMKNNLEDLRKEFDAVKKPFVDTATSQPNSAKKFCEECRKTFLRNYELDKHGGYSWIRETLQV